MEAEYDAAVDLDKPASGPRGIAPGRWGPAAWTFIHYVALGYPREPTLRDIDEYRRFLESLRYVLPCRMCREHLRDHMFKHPPDSALAGGRDTLFEWTVDLHNLVNRSLGKRSVSPEAIFKWYATRHLGVSPQSACWLHASLGAVAALILALALACLIRCLCTKSRKLYSKYEFLAGMKP